jgi:hypothetical protein
MCQGILFLPENTFFCPSAMKSLPAFLLCLFLGAVLIALLAWGML